MSEAQQETWYSTWFRRLSRAKYGFYSVFDGSAQQKHCIYSVFRRLSRAKYGIYVVFGVHFELFGFSPVDSSGERYAFWGFDLVFNTYIWNIYIHIYRERDINEKNVPHLLGACSRLGIKMCCIRVGTWLPSVWHISIILWLYHGLCALHIEMLVCAETNTLQAYKQTLSW